MQRILFLLLALLTIVHTTQAQDVRSQLRQIANDLAKQIEGKGKKRVVIASFLDLDNKETQLGRYMSDKFSIGISTASLSLEITDRSQLAQLLIDNKLAAQQILDPKTIPRLGGITGAEVIITGNYTVLDNSVDITVKAIDLVKGLRMAVAEGTVPRTSEINKLLGEAIGSPDPTAPSDPNANKVIPDKDKNCSINHTGSYCFQNTTKVDIRISTSGGVDLIVHPGQVECEFGVLTNGQGEINYNVYVYRNAKESTYETRRLLVTECQQKMLIIR